MKSMSRLQKVLLGVILLLIVWIAVILVIRNQRGNTAEKQDNQHNYIELSEKKLVSLIKTAARNFENTYSKDYASKYLYYKTVSGKDKYLEFVGSQGVILSCKFNQDGEVLHLMDKNSLHQWYPVGIMRSYPWDIGGERLFAYSSKRLSSNPIPKDSEYTDIPNVPTSIVDFKRTLEVYSPLNPKHIKDFDYVIKATSGDDYVIGFLQNQA